ncbi:hypothetical protein BDZ89DRAFT_1141665 [Hymenopellis radicata]|nr:hypothetical protein BDZ89DRAFT_1141665 [Hymenopellis radicata]
MAGCTSCPEDERCAVRDPAGAAKDICKLHISLFPTFHPEADYPQLVALGILSLLPPMTSELSVLVQHAGALI